MACAPDADCRDREALLAELLAAGEWLADCSRMSPLRAASTIFAHRTSSGTMNAPPAWYSSGLFRIAAACFLFVVWWVLFGSAMSASSSARRRSYRNDGNRRKMMGRTYRL